MPTDEQRMREAFEVVRVAEYDILSVDRDPETGEYARRSTYEAWGNFIGGWLARDAEVQALRQALVDIGHYIDGESAIGGVESGVRIIAGEIIRAALAGGETGETE